MNHSKLFPDRSNLEHIKKNLWTGRPFGKAAVMVGAGFSMNAEPRKVDAKLFPTWKQLAGRIYDELYPSTGSSGMDYEEAKLAATAGLGALRLASEYETSFGPQELDKLLLNTIPFESYGPGDLHRLLLRLPWSDIFTTNYDTLLEDARVSVPGKRYDPILTASDIPQGKKPRIVKLHGTFPANRPFIFTEEDYRTYPAKFAPFVNLVQQSLMENTFCLIGFSGDDPNFLNWLGWVRDNLGEHTPKLYLCGILNLSVSERKLLESRNVIPVDLSPLYPDDQYPDRSQRHAEALKWFLNELWKGKPPHILDWPRVPQQPVAVTHVAAVEESKASVEDLLSFDPSGPRGDVSSEQLLQLLLRWKQQRLSYPGWLVCPRKNRRFLWNLTKYWIHPIAVSVESVSFPDNLLLLRELNWRLEKSLVPVPGIKGVIESVINSCNPFPALVTIPDSSVDPRNTQYDGADWKDIEGAWLELVFAIVRKAREDFEDTTFRQWMSVIENVVPRKREWQPRYWYEWCLFHLFRLDWNSLTEALNKWPSEFDPPFWQVKRASIIAEVSQRPEAERLVSMSLDTIMHSIDPDRDDYGILSQEGWATLLSSLVITNRKADPGEGTDPYRGRWAELSVFRCNPWAEIEIMASDLDREPPVPAPEKEEKIRDGKRQPVYTITAQSLWELRLPGFAFLRQFEEAGQPVSIGFFDVAGSAAIRAVQWIFSLSPIMAISFLVRLGNREFARDWFDTFKAAALTQNQVDTLAHILTDGLRQGLAILQDSTGQGRDGAQGFALRLVATVPDLLASVCFRLSGSDRSKLLDLIVQTYAHHIFGSGIGMERSLKRLVNNVISSMTTQEILQRMPILLNLPLPQKDGFNVSYPDEWVEPFEIIRIRLTEVTGLTFDSSNWQQPILDLLKAVETAPVFARTNALIRLNALNAIGALTDEQQNALKNALWSRTNPAFGLPADTSFRPQSLLLQVGADEKDGKGAFKKWILGLDFPRILVSGDKSEGWSVGGKSIHRSRIINEIVGSTQVLLPRDEKLNEMRIDWAHEEALEILRKAAEWWRVNKEDLHDEIVQSELAMRDELRGELGKIVPLFAYVVLPRLKEADGDSRNLALNVLHEMEEANFSTFVCDPMTLFVDSARSDELGQKLRRGLVSTERAEVNDSIEGTFMWLLHGLRGSIPKAPEDLINELVNMIVSRRQPGLVQALDRIATITRHFPEVLGQDRITSLCLALEYLRTETELPPDLDAYRRSVPHPTIPVEERPDCRELAAALANAIHTYLSKIHVQPHQILVEWQEICKTDILPEVRRAWS